MAEQGVEPREVEKARNNLRAHLLRELHLEHRPGPRAGHLRAVPRRLGSTGSRLPEAYGRVDAAQVQAAARRWLNPTQRSVVTLVPEDGQT